VLGQGWDSPPPPAGGGVFDGGEQAGVDGAGCFAGGRVRVFELRGDQLGGRGEDRHGDGRRPQVEELGGRLLAGRRLGAGGDQGAYAARLGAGHPAHSPARRAVVITTNSCPPAGISARRPGGHGVG